MKTHKQLQQRLAQGDIIVMDGAMGTEILHHGVATTLPLWSAEALLTHPEIVQRIHESYIAAGAEIIITDTFCTTEWTFAKRGIADKARDATLLACQLAWQAIEHMQPQHEVYIAGSMAPLEDCYSPELTPPEEDLQREHYLYAESLKAGGVDFLLLETMITLRETLAAIHAAQQLALPFAVSFCVNEQGELLSGEPLAQVIKVVEAYDPLFVGVNCVSPVLATKTLRILKKSTDRPLSVYAQGDGMPTEDQGWLFLEENTLDKYMLQAKQWIEEGAQIVGGCCGTGPAYIEKLHQTI